MKNRIAWILMFCVLVLIAGCASRPTSPPVLIAETEGVATTTETHEPTKEQPTISADEVKEKIGEARDWYIGDIWNTFVDIDSYVAGGTSATGSALDIDFAVEQFDKAMQKKADYDAFMAGLDGDYAEIGTIWAKVSVQIDEMDAFVRGDIVVGGDRFDTGLIDQYSTAFDDLVYDLD